jgi:hypothetical protein
LRLGFGNSDLMNPHHHNHHLHRHQVQGVSRNFNHQHFQPHIYGRDFKRNTRVVNGVKRSVRAPRMRWTTTLHSHFVHAVQLLGGHESKHFNSYSDIHKHLYDQRLCYKHLISYLSQLIYMISLIL